MTIQTSNESTDTSVRISAEIPAPADEVWRYVGDPRRHAEFDGSGMIRGCDTGDPVTHEDQVFVMEMTWTDGVTEYRTENYVTRVEPGRALEWLVADEGRRPQGWRWGWEISSSGNGTTLVSNYCDWGDITDPEIVEQKGFPVVDHHAVTATVENLAEKVS